MENVPISIKGLNFVGQLFDLEGKLINWTAIKNEYHLLESKSFHWMQVVDVLQAPRKQSIIEQNTKLNGFGLFDHHLIKKKQVYSLGKLSSKKLYNILILGNYKNQRHKGIFESSTICKSAKETIISLFSKCLCAQYIWNQTQIFISGCITIRDVTPQSVILGITDTSTEHFLLISKL